MEKNKKNFITIFIRECEYIRNTFDSISAKQLEIIEHELNKTIFYIVGKKKEKNHGIL